MAPAKSKSATAVRYELVLINAPAGYLKTFEGGNVVGVVEEIHVGSDPFPHKHITILKFEDIAITCGIGMSKGFYDEIKQFYTGAAKPFDGSILAVDPKFAILSELDFNQAMIIEVAMPALDAASKDSAKISVKFSPEHTALKKATSNLRTKSKDPIKKWLPSNFRLTINQVDCTRISKIEAVTITPKMTDTTVGEKRTFATPPGQFQISNLVVTVDEAHAQDFYDWHKSFVIDGKNGETNEKNGKLEYLSPDLKTALFTLTFRNLGIFKVAPDPTLTKTDVTRRVVAEMYCQHIEFSYDPTAATS